MSVKLTKWDAADYLDSPEMVAGYISEALETGDIDFIKAALNDVARARGMSQVSKDANVTREALYRALSEKGDPRMSTLFGVLSALGIQLTATAVESEPA